MFSSEKTTPQLKLSTEIFSFIISYCYISLEFTYAKMSAIVQQLANNNALDKQQNIEIIAATLFIMSIYASNIYGIGMPFDKDNILQVNICTIL